MSASSPPGAAPRSRHSGNELTRWQISAGFETHRHEEFRGPGTLGEQLSDYAFHTYGANVTLARYFNNWVGFEGAVAGAFGHTTAPSHLVNRFLWYGAGPRIAYRHSHRLEPFAHVEVGGAHFWFLNSGTLPSGLNTFGFLVGAGNDFKFGRHLGVRLEVDLLGTHFLQNWQKDIPTKLGVVVNF